VPESRTYNLIFKAVANAPKSYYFQLNGETIENIQAKYDPKNQQFQLLNIVLKRTDTFSASLSLKYLTQEEFTQLLHNQLLQRIKKILGAFKLVASIKFAVMQSINRTTIEELFAVPLGLQDEFARVIYEMLGSCGVEHITNNIIGRMEDIVLFWNNYNIPHFKYNISNVSERKGSSEDEFSQVPAHFFIAVDKNAKDSQLMQIDTKYGDLKIEFKVGKERKEEKKKIQKYIRKK